MITAITPFKVIQFYLHRFCYHIKLVWTFCWSTVLTYILSCTVSKWMIGHILLPLFNTLVWGEPLNSRLQRT